MTTLKDRLKQGKDARKNCPRSAQAATGKTSRDPLPLIKRSSEGRGNSLVELRYGHMLVSPFTFYRGNALLQAHDLAFKVVGVGTRCLVALLTDEQEFPLFLQFKEARRSVLADYVKAKSRVRHNGQRVVDGQRLMQSASDLFLGWTTGPNGRHFYVRQLRDMKISAELETFDAEAFAAYGRICGRARAHAKSSGHAAQISGYIGKSDALADALFKYAKTYTEQNDRDFERFQQACRKGRLRARSEADFAADHLP